LSKGAQKGAGESEKAGIESKRRDDAARDVAMLHKGAAKRRERFIQTMDRRAERITAYRWGRPIAGQQDPDPPDCPRPLLAKKQPRRVAIHFRN
jgi:hypothetical protein